MSDLKKQLKDSGLINSFGQPLSAGQLSEEGCSVCETCVGCSDGCTVCTDCVGCTDGCTACTDSVTGDVDACVTMASC